MVSAANSSSSLSPVASFSVALTAAATEPALYASFGKPWDTPPWSASNCAACSPSPPASRWATCAMVSRVGSSLMKAAQARQFAFLFAFAGSWASSVWFLIRFL